MGFPGGDRSTTDAAAAAPNAVVAPTVASPLATGDYGGRFQDAVGGWFLAKLLTSEPVLASSGELARVGFQRALHGAQLDDIVAESTAGLSVEFSIKVGVVIRPGDRELRETLTRAWAGFQANEHTWSGLIAPPTATGISDLALLVFHARQHSDVDDFMRATMTPETVSVEKRRRYAACRTILDEANGAPLTNLQFHSFLRRFVVLTLDFAIPDHGALESIYTSLSTARGISREQARVLFDRLVAIGEDAAIASANLERPSLLERLRQDGVPAGFAAHLAPDVAALDAYAQRTFEARRYTVAGVRLERADTTDAIVAAIEGGKTALLGGPSGYGKSAVLREVYSRLAVDGPVLHLSGRRVATAGSWVALADDIGLPHDRARFAEVLGTNVRGVTVVLDALEHVQTTGARAVVNDLLRDLHTRCRTVNVVLATRELLVADVLRWLDATTLRPLERITLDTLDPLDATRIAEAAPELRGLIARVAGKPIPGGLVVLELLHDARVPPAALAATPATEADLLDVWWDYVVLGNDADRYARRAVARAAAEAVVHACGGLFQLPNGLDGNAIGALDVDGVLVLDAQLDAYRFGHDIIQDWAIVRWLDSAGTDVEAHVTTLAQVPGFYRCAALFAQRLAERTPERYDALLSRLENAGDTRGVQAFLSALALSPRAQALLDARAVMLLENGAARLAALLNVLRTEHVDINVNIVDIARGRGMDIGSALLGGVMYGTPRYVVWAAALRFCISHLDALGCATLPFAQMADRWQQTTPPGVALRAGLFAATMRILAQLEGWRRHEAETSAITIRYEDEESIERAARSAAAHAADVDPAAMARYLEDLREHGYSNAQDDMLGHAGAISLALTDEVVAYVVSVLSERERLRPWERDSSELGLRSHKYYPASDLQGPFLALLRSNEAAGLAVVRQLTARSLAHYERAANRGGFGRQPAHLRSLTFSFRGRTVTLRGDERAYTWFRPGTSDDSSVLTSALMALDTWAIESVRNGRDPGEVTDLLLTDTECVALLGIAVGLAYDVPALSPDLVDVIGQPWLWRLEFYRVRYDTMPDNVNALLPAAWQFPTLRPDLQTRNRERDAGRFRPRHPAQLAMTYLFLSASTVRQAFLDRTGAAELVDACLWDEEQMHVGESPDTREEFEHFQAFVNPDNYERTGHMISFHRPAHMQRRAEEQQAALAHASMMTAGLMAANALHDYAAPAGMRVADFEEVGRRFEEDLNAGRVSGDDARYAREAVVRCAGVAVTFGPQADLPASAWATNVILNAARAQAALTWSADRDDGSALDERIGIATALGALVASDPNNDELRSLALQAVAKGPRNVGASVLRGVTPAWQRRPGLALNIFFLLIEAALRDGDGGVPDDVVTVYDAAVRNGTRGPVPDVRACSAMAMYRLEHVLPALPDTFMGAETLDVLVAVAQQLLTTARGEETEDDCQFPFSFAWEVGRFAANVFVALPADGYAAFRASVCDWAASLDVFAETVRGVISRHVAMYELTDNAVERFCALAEPFLSADHRARLDHHHLNSEFQKACWALVFCASLQGVMIKADWPHAARFAEHIDRWVRAVGGHPSTANALVAFIDRFATAFSTAQLVKWITISATQTAERNRSEFWRLNGETIGALLLRLRDERPGDFGQPALRTAAAAIADSLVTAGVAIAGEVRRAFEAPTAAR
jgi:hypothetical protein